MSSDLLVRYSSKLGEVDVSGRTRDLEELAGVLVTGSGLLATPIEGDPSPYEVFLSSIMMRSAREGPIVLSVDEGKGILDIFGSPNFLRLLAENIQDLCRHGVSGEHLHIEYFPGHFYLAESQISLVVHRST